ncbi:Leucine-rich receptor-like protein kinase family protein [Abeliophyllum distichum]|uniref:non-specific serine/threonine protein kinase n=1 Tax=Abeliophyllum distichum TaxID=126358 RepID=A0ABD1SEA3_9LAMI
MSPAINFWQILQFLSLFSLLSFAASDELQTLLTIKSAFKESNTKVFDSWDANNSVCKFTGLTCDSNGFVKEIELSNQNLTGSIPFDSVCKLPSLEKLSLGFNSLYGQVTDELKNCTGLKYLDLGNNFFSGSFPDISSISGLLYLYANQSGFSGSFPWNSLENMTNLAVLSLGDNPFDRTEFPPVIVKLTKLNWLYLSNCSIQGKIPRGIGNLVELIDLELSMNYITGEIPVEIANLSKLWQLELYSNELTGKLPAGFGNLKSLEYFDASTNYLNGDLSEIRFLNLVSLQLFQNEFTGELPAELGEFKKLVNLSLYSNKLTGQLPEKLGSWADFDYIDVSENYLTGPIPPEMCKRGTMKQLLILQNNFTGPIPDTYANCTTLIRFRVSKNSLSGTVPGGIWGLPNLEIIDIAFNNLEGPITTDIGGAKSMTQLFLANNRLSGELPSEISMAAALVSIDLSDNQFSGVVPASIGELKHLNSLQLQSNKFSDSIPDSLGSCDSITVINMARNSLTGQIPASLGSLPTLNFLNLSGNQLSGLIPGSLASLRLSLLDISNNHLSGPIPESLLIQAYNGSFDGNEGLCSEKIGYFQRCSQKSGMHRHLPAVIFCFLAGFLVLLVSLAYFCYLKKKTEKQRDRSLKEESWDVKSYYVFSITEDEILDSIKQENLIGKGGSGNVYRVVLANGKELAVKHIWHPESGDRKKFRSTTPILGSRGTKSREFEAEVRTLSSVRHVNVVKLYCSITSEDSSLLVYEYLPNGSLWDRLHTCKKLVLDWDARYEIALGAAKGLEYLHHGCNRPIIHRDVKSSNILLDEFLKPRIADFGLAKIVQLNSTESTQMIAGTHGYIAPEYGYTHKVNEKSDLYSFGVVLMELVTGKRPIEAEYGENKDIVEWVCSKLKTKESVLSIVDSAIPEVYKEDAIKVLKIGIMCTARLPTLRPTMRSVVQMLEEAEPCKLVGIIVSKDGVTKNEEPRDKKF